ncbi:hypothetical protein BT67DRAFT_444203 [Trichocladium antarcticum]|uniref:Uncharacterized protein n=1 Tax=Trichocladium antarcticum TaxID=1450529 RepID=A0AAN6UFK7_9PEZI|nr:hypothetical protein BT67DRAFT_444203 [Trichocladium antarcticum]
MSNDPPSSSSKNSSSGGSSKSTSKDKSDKRSASSRTKAKTTLQKDPAAVSLSNRTGIDGFVHQSFHDGPWSSVGAAGCSS